jgi:hypothetical protein
MLAAELSTVRKQLANWEAGVAGEVRVAEILGQLPAGWRVLHDRRKSPRSPANIDHIAIGPTGVHVIDAKNWTGRLFEGDRGIVCGRWPRNQEAESARITTSVVAQTVGSVGYHVPVFGVIALVNPDNTAEAIVSGGVAFMPAARLRDAMTNLPIALNPEQVYRLWERLDDLHPPRASKPPVSAPRSRANGSRQARRPRTQAPHRTPRAPQGQRRSSPRRRQSSAFVLLELIGTLVFILLVIGLFRHEANTALQHLPSPIPSTATSSSR